MPNRPARSRLFDVLVEGLEQRVQGELGGPARPLRAPTFAGWSSGRRDGARPAPPSRNSTVVASEAVRRDDLPALVRQLKMASKS